MSDIRDITRETCGSYDANARTYTEASEDYEQFPGLHAEVVEFARLAPHHLPVLDLGCGGGRDSRLLASLGRTVIAGDYAPVMLDQARSRSTAGDRPPSFVRLNALALPIRPASVAGVWASGSLLHIPVALMEHALTEIHRVLIPGGVTAISMRTGEGEGWRNGGSMEGRRWFTFTDPDTFTKYLGKTGFSDTRIHYSGRPGWFVAIAVR
ncbi:hypothetical protein GCM10022254_59070 [Actinomadura meridiana]|uniref:Methyltransferase domain-containing protein n=1 Tax=Actinomadura meridiana TaxID=559626 RepID=A0ABP8CHX4_9ACTN